MALDVAFYTLGCKVNQYETEAIMELFQQRGYNIVDYNDAADVYIINTCTVTSRGDAKSRALIRKALKKNENAVIAVVGCYPQTSPEEVISIPGVDIIAGTDEKSRIVDLVEDYLRNHSKIINIKDIRKNRKFERLSVLKNRDRTRAYIKIEDGCDLYCTYCIVPYARGPVRSKPYEEVMDEARKLANEGFKEVVITGIHISSYGKDLGNVGLLDVLRGINDIEGICRIRLSSLEPRILTEDNIKEITSLEKLCRFFHISLQSGSDETLRRMHRRYTADEYRQIVYNLRKYIPDAGIATDIMVGFPGETDEEFKESYNFVKEMNFSHMHVFQYSPRKGTKAYEYEGQVEKKVKEERSRMMIELAREMKVGFNRRFIGTTMDVLFENDTGDGIYEGLTDNYIRVLAKGDESMRNIILPAKLLNLNGLDVVGEIV
ncbi:MAG: tRNA (N(6)-L-threonylcarbamoyladenosine(37)-C(2))-methylthiotransferase MtaB [Thermoanaerobacteraceae bacterium]|nr:tRNA (N(6)-L-threonylcarbamoyladenosine(37)-C(2))-methylthiotransferase MtaB [Thermoanaerobacteraceae bacterium]